jgi:hypothetical protein
MLESCGCPEAGRSPSRRSRLCRIADAVRRRLRCPSADPKAAIPISAEPKNRFNWRTPPSARSPLLGLLASIHRQLSSTRPGHSELERPFCHRPGSMTMAFADRRFRLHPAAGAARMQCTLDTCEHRSIAKRFSEESHSPSSNGLPPRLFFRIGGDEDNRRGVSASPK